MPLLLLLSSVSDDIWGDNSFLNDCGVHATLFCAYVEMTGCVGHSRHGHSVSLWEHCILEECGRMRVPSVCVRDYAVIGLGMSHTDETCR